MTAVRYQRHYQFSQHFLIQIVECHQSYLYASLVIDCLVSSLPSLFLNLFCQFSHFQYISYRSHSTLPHLKNMTHFLALNSICIISIMCACYSPWSDLEDHVVDSAITLFEKAQSSYRRIYG